MNITLYTTNDCKFSQAAKDYFKAKNIPFEEKNLEANRQNLTEMLTVSNNFAGTPVTKIDKDDGSSIVLKGFTADEFDKALGTVTTEQTVAAAQADIPLQQAPVEETMATPAPVTPAIPDMSSMPVPPPSPASQPVEQKSSPLSEQIGPISLSADMPEQKETPVSTTPQPVMPPSSMQMPADQPVPAPVMTPPVNPAVAPTQPPIKSNPDEQLNSVLQNLQSQVNGTPGSEDKPASPTS